jgi:hypothetical protein
MSNRKKRFVRQYAAEHGLSYQSAHNAIDGRGADTSNEIVLHAFVSDSSTAFSLQCTCGRWIYCGDDEHDDECVCGQAYRVVFDGPLDWSQPQGMRCTDCGCAFAMAPVEDGRSPWRVLNAWQQQCHRCASKEHERVTKDRQNANFRVTVAQHLHRQTIESTQSMLDSAEKLYDGEEIARLIAAVRSALDDITTKHIPRVMPAIAAGRDERDQAFEQAYLTLHERTRALQHAQDAWWARRTEEQQKQAEAFTAQVERWKKLEQLFEAMVKRTLN